MIVEFEPSLTELPSGRIIMAGESPAEQVNSRGLGSSLSRFHRPNPATDHHHSRISEIARDFSEPVSFKAFLECLPVALRLFEGRPKVEFGVVQIGEKLFIVGRFGDPVAECLLLAV